MTEVVEPALYETFPEIENGKPLIHIKHMLHAKTDRLLEIEVVSIGAIGRGPASFTKQGLFRAISW